MRWSFERFLTLVSVDKGASMGDDGAGDEGSEDEGTIVGRYMAPKTMAKTRTGTWPRKDLGIC